MRDADFIKPLPRTAVSQFPVKPGGCLPPVEDDFAIPQFPGKILGSQGQLFPQALSLISRFGTKLAHLKGIRVNRMQEQRAEESIVLKETEMKILPIAGKVFIL